MEKSAQRKLKIMLLNVLTILGLSGLLYWASMTGMTVLIQFLAFFLVSLGVLFFAGTCIGLLRFPDFYTRLHAAGKGDTLSSLLILLGCATYAFFQGHLDIATGLVGIKILLIINFIFVGSPTATHAIMDAGYETEVKHWVKKPGRPPL